MSEHAKLWLLERPVELDDQKDLEQNGIGRYRHTMPGLVCSYCHETWTGLRVLDCECPQAYANVAELNRPCPAPLKRFRDIARLVALELERQGIHRSLRPGDSFQPARLRFAAVPRHDFLWSVIGYPVVQPWVKELFEAQNITGIRFVESVVEQVGTGPLQPLAVSEPEDIFDLPSKNAPTVEFSPLYQMVVLQDGPYRIGTRILKKCPHCGREEFDTEKSKEAVPKGELPGTDMFFIGGTLRILVSQKVADIVKSNSCSNVNLTEFQVL